MSNISLVIHPKGMDMV